MASPPTESTGVPSTSGLARWTPIRSRSEWPMPWPGLISTSGPRSKRGVTTVVPGLPMIEPSPSARVLPGSRRACSTRSCSWDVPMPLSAASATTRGATEEAQAWYREAVETYRGFSERDPDRPDVYNELAWLLSTCPDARTRDPIRALSLARAAVERSSGDGTYRRTLGVVHYRVGHWAEAISELEESMRLRTGREPATWFFLAMAHWQRGHHDQARPWYDQAAGWMAEHRSDNPEFRRFRARPRACWASPTSGCRMDSTRSLRSSRGTIDSARDLIRRDPRSPFGPPAAKRADFGHFKNPDKGCVSSARRWHSQILSEPVQRLCSGRGEQRTFADPAPFGARSRHP